MSQSMEANEHIDLLAAMYAEGILTAENAPRLLSAHFGISEEQSIDLYVDWMITRDREAARLSNALESKRNRLDKLMRKLSRLEANELALGFEFAADLDNANTSRSYRRAAKRTSALEERIYDLQDDIEDLEDDLALHRAEIISRARADMGL